MLSILLPVYNGARFLSSSIESVLNQTYTNFELLIGFNGTIDRSKIIASSFKDERIRIFDYGNDAGKAKTLNKLIKEAKSNFISLQDDDDVWFPNKLELQLRYIENYDVVGTQIKYIDEHGKPFNGPVLALIDKDIKLMSLNKINQIANTSVITKKDDILSVGGWDESLDALEDYDLWLKLMLKNKTFINLPQILVYHRLHKASNFNNKSNQANLIDYLIKKYNFAR